MNQMRQHSGGGSHRRWVTAFLVAMAAISPAPIAKMIVLVFVPVNDQALPQNICSGFDVSSL